MGYVLTDMYSKSGNVVFGIDPECRNVVSYTCLIDGFVETEQIEKALSVFVELSRQGNPMSSLFPV